MLSRAMPVRNIKHAKMAKIAPKTNGNTKLMSTALNVWFLTTRQLLLVHMNHGYRRYKGGIGGKLKKGIGIKHAKMAEMASKTNGNTKLMSHCTQCLVSYYGRQLLLAHMNHGYRIYNSEIGGKAQQPHCFVHTFQNLLINWE